METLDLMRHTDVQNQQANFTVSFSGFKQKRKNWEIYRFTWKHGEKAFKACPYVRGQLLWSHTNWFAEKKNNKNAR